VFRNVIPFERAKEAKHREKEHFFCESLKNAKKCDWLGFATGMMSMNYLSECQNLHTAKPICNNAKDNRLMMKELQKFKIEKFT